MTPLLLAGVVGCGGGSTKTVTQTVAAAPVPAPQTAPSETVTTQTLPSEPGPTEKPPANLPAGTIAVQGRFHMRLISESNTGFASSHEKDGAGGRERLWVTKTSCTGTCEVELRRELSGGGYETVVLSQVKGDPTRYASDAKVKTNYCANKDGAIGHGSRRISLKVSATKDVGGQPAAVRLDGYLVARQHCSIFDDKTASANGVTKVLFRGTAAGA